MKIIKTYYMPILALLVCGPLGAARAMAAGGAAFLKMDASARSAGMGSASTAVADDASALTKNAAGMSSLAKRQAYFTHSNGFAETRFESAGFVQPFGKNALGIGFSHLSLGETDGRTADRKPSGAFSSADMSVTLSGSRSFGSMSLGSSVKWLRQSISSEKADGIAVDLGGKFQSPGSPLSLGLALQNAGPQMKFVEQSYSLPTTLSAGAAYHLGRSWTAALDVSHDLPNAATNLGIGTEFWMMNAFALRAGYLASAASGSRQSPGANPSSGLDLGQASGFGAGLGLRMSRYQLDYAIVPHRELGSSHRISISASF